MTLALFGAAGSCSIAAQIALEETGAAYAFHALRLQAGEQRHAEYLALNRRGRVPTLIVDDRPIGELIAILTAIATLFPEAELLPFGDPVALARAYERMGWYATGLHVAVAQIFRTERFAADEGAWPAIRDGGRATLEKGFAEIDERLTGPWIMGERYSVLDGYTHAFWRWGQRLEMNMEARPNWAGHNRRLLARPAVADALAREKQADQARVTAMA